jgi:hypothetical protein
VYRVPLVLKDLKVLLFQVFKVHRAFKDLWDFKVVKVYRD